MELNLENLQRLKDWLLAGAPHAYFNMCTALASTDYANISDRTRFDTLEDFLEQTGQAPKPDCGTICCIAGAAYLMSKAAPHQLFPDEQDYPYDWDTIQDGALAFLGLPNHGFSHPLFDPDLAPENCTPAQAAVAVQRVMQGRHPWH